jgi:hypothetical protein
MFAEALILEIMDIPPIKAKTSAPTIKGTFTDNLMAHFPQKYFIYYINNT